LKENAPPELAEQFMDRHRGMIMSQSQNPEYENQMMREVFGALGLSEEELTEKLGEAKPDVQPYTREFPEGEDILDEKVEGSPEKEYGEMRHFYDSASGELRAAPPEATGFLHEWQEANKSEPIEIAFRLLKERKSPEAFANKKKYDSEYQKTPKRVKYREQLNAERRKRGIYGKGGKDVSHTQGGKLTLESAHSNRARHFKNRGTLRRVK
jgi:uncharacterized protein YdaT